MPAETDRFERMLLPLMDDAYTLARYLVRDEHDAQDVVQEAYLRAWRHFGGWRGHDARDARAWLLTIVRHCCATWRAGERRRGIVEYTDDEHAEPDDARHATDTAVEEQAERETLEHALERLPAEYREILVLREVQDLSYREIARVIGAPEGTVMSRLSRARQRLRDVLRTSAREAS